MGLVVALTAAPFLTGGWGAIPAALALVLTIIAGRHGHGPALHLGVAVTLLVGMLAIPPVWPTWPLPLLAALGVYAGVRRTGRLPEWTAFERGCFDRRSVALMLLFIGASALALVGWWWLLQPDLSDASDRIPPVSPVLLVLAGLGFAAANALGEELMWRGLVARAMESSGVRIDLALLLQALSFGLVHIHGFPRGWIGVLLAAIYGLMMGVLRRTSGGLLVPWVAHVCADLVIFGVLAMLAFG